MTPVPPRPPSASRFEIDGDSRVVLVAGELDAITSPLLLAVAHTFLRESPGALVLDLASVTSTVPPLISAGGVRRSATSLEVVVDAQVATQLRRDVSAVLQAGSVGEGVLSDVELLVTELVTNVIRHEAARLINVEVVVDALGAVTVTVTGGVGDPAPAFVQPIRLPSPSSESGRGLFIVDALAATWGTRRRDGRTSVWFTIGDDSSGSGEAADFDETSSAVAVMADAVAVVAATAASLTAEPQIVAARAAATTEQAAITAALRTAGAAQVARAARTAAATSAAASIAEAAARTLAAVQAHADQLASAVALAAADAASAVALSIVPGGDAEAARAAREVHSTVLAAAVAKAEETAQAALVVAQAVASAAAQVASTTASEAAAIEHEVRAAALALEAVTAATARELAADTLERDAAVALAARQAIAASDEASERLHEANRQLRRAGVHDRAVAVALQEAMLTHLPEQGDLQLAARYLTAAEEDQVGGDWYDAVVLPTGSTTLVIGDVIGHDIEAAATMGQLRNILRALVWERNHPPSDVVGRLDRAIRDLRIDTIASLVLVDFEPPAPDETASVGTLRWTNAGHPAPILIHADGRVVTLERPADVLLGVRPESVRRDHTHQVPPGATLLLYTDGLVETRTESIEAGQLRLFEAARTHHRLDPGDLLDAVLADMVGDRPSDDVAVLAVRFQPS